MGVDVAHVGEFMPGAPDEDVIAEAIRRDAVILTFDRDFGELTFRQRIASAGVVLFRMRPRPASTVLSLVRSFFSSKPVAYGHFTVVSPGQVRQRPFLHLIREAESGQDQ